MFTRRIAYLLLIALGFLAYFNALGNGFVWDDEFLVRNNSFIRNHTYIAQSFSTELHHGEAQGNFYRPLLTISLMVDYFFWGLDPLGYHLTNVFLHLICALLIYELARSLLQDTPITTKFGTETKSSYSDSLHSSGAVPLVVAAIFLVHPINTEAITYISGRTDPMMTLFLISSLLLFRAAHLNPRISLRYVAYALSVICFLGALLSREASLIYPLILLWYGFVFLRPISAERQRWWFKVIPFFVLAAIFLVWRAHVLRDASTEMLSYNLSLSQKIVFSLRALAGYFGLLLFPLHLQMERQVIWGDWSLSLMTFLGALIVYGWIFVMRISRLRQENSCRGWPLIHFGLGWFAIALLPVSGLFDVNATMAEHWLYLPSIGFYLAVSDAGKQFLGSNSARRFESLLSRGIAIALATVVLLFAVRTLLRNQDWVDSVSFYQETLRAEPLSLRIQNNLATQMMNQGDYKAAIAQLERTLKRAGRGSLRSTILTNLAVAYIQTKNFDRARHHLQQAIAETPKDPIIYFDLAVLDEKLDQTAEAETQLRQAVNVCPGSVTADVNLAQFLMRKQRWKEAREQLQQALKIEPGKALLHNLLGLVLYAEKDIPGTLAAFQCAAKLDRHSPEALFYLALLHRENGEWDLAEKALENAVRIAPGNVQLHFHLGLLYWRQKMWEEASDTLKRALALSPKDPLIRFAADQINQHQELSAALAVSPSLQPEHPLSQLTPSGVAEPLPKP